MNGDLWDMGFRRPLRRTRIPGSIVEVPIGNQSGPRARFRIQEAAVWPVPPGTWYLNPWAYAQRSPVGEWPAQAHEAVAWTYMDLLEPLPGQETRLRGLRPG